MIWECPECGNKEEADYVPICPACEVVMFQLELYED